MPPSLRPFPVYLPLPDRGKKVAAEGRGRGGVRAGVLCADTRVVVELFVGSRWGRRVSLCCVAIGEVVERKRRRNRMNGRWVDRR